jgi:hypothetical protein
MNVGDLVMWMGLDEDNGCLGIITERYMKRGGTFYTVIWQDGDRGVEIEQKLLLRVDDD